MIDGKELTQPPPPPPKVGRLDSLKAVRLEMAKVYKDARKGAAKMEDASRLAFILMSLAKLIEQGDIEQRLEQLERSLKLQQQSPLRNGVHHAN